MKTQIWLESHQVELVARCLDHACKQLSNNVIGSDVHAMAGNFVIERIKEIRPLFKVKP